MPTPPGIISGGGRGSSGGEANRKNGARDGVIGVPSVVAVAADGDK